MTLNCLDDRYRSSQPGLNSTTGATDFNRQGPRSEPISVSVYISNTAKHGSKDSKGRIVRGDPPYRLGKASLGRDNGIKQCQRP